MHASIEQLLSLRDDDVVDDGLKQHVHSCALCLERLDELVAVRDELRRMPVMGPQHNRWPKILEAAGLGKATAGAKRKTWFAGVGLAASVLLASVVVISQRPFDTSPGDVIASDNNSPVSAQVDDVADDRQPRKWTTEEIEALVARSQRLEQTLSAMPRRPSVKRASTSDTIMGLQQGIAMVDYQINYGSNVMTPKQSQRLWQQRVDLMNSLVSVRYAETQPRRVVSRP